MPDHDHSFVKAFRDSGHLHRMLSEAVFGEAVAD